MFKIKERKTKLFPSLASEALTRSATALLKPAMTRTMASDVNIGIYAVVEGTVDVLEIKCCKTLFYGVVRVTFA